MTKIFKYELKIILLKPYVFVMTVITLLYAYFKLTSDTIMGVSDTAPFSGWSFGDYMGDVNLISMLVTLFIMATLFSKQQKKVSILTDVTGFPVRSRMLIRNVIIGGFFILNNLLIFILGCGFLGALFGVIYPAVYIADWLLITIPSLLVILGVGNLLGKINPVLIYVFMAVLIVMSFVLSEYAIDINGANYYTIVSSALETLKGGETPFTITPSFIFTRLVYLILGIVSLAMVTARAGEKSKKDIL